MESDSSQVFTNSPNKFSGQLMTCDPQELLPHPSYARHGLTVSSDSLSAVRARRELAFLEPIITTRGRLIVDGYARWELAKELKRPILHCIEYDLSETDALALLLQRHRSPKGLNDYLRIELNQRENRWVHFRHVDKYALMYWWRFAVVHYLAAVLGAEIENVSALHRVLSRQCKRPWNIHIKRFSSKWHFLRYAARYLRRPPIAEHRLISMTDEHVEYWANDLKLKAWVRIKVSAKEFLELLIQHVPDRYAHSIRYFGLTSPAGKSLFSNAIFVLLRDEQKPRPKRLSFEAMSVKYFGTNPVLDSHGQRMSRVGRQAPVSARLEWHRAVAFMGALASLFNREGCLSLLCQQGAFPTEFRDFPFPKIDPATAIS